MNIRNIGIAAAMVISFAGVGEAQSDVDQRYGVCEYLGNTAALAMEYRQMPGATLHSLVRESASVWDESTRALVLGLSEAAFLEPYYHDENLKTLAIADFANGVMMVCLEAQK